MPSSDNDVQVVDTKKTSQRTVKSSKKFVVTMGQFLSEKPVTAQLLANEKAKARPSMKSAKSPVGEPKAKARSAAKSADDSSAAPKLKPRSNGENAKASTKPKENTDEAKPTALLMKTM